MLSGDREEGDAIAVALLSRLSDLAPVCFVNGNHEMCVERHQPERYQKFMDDLKNGGVQILHNETACFWIDGEKVAVTGYELRGNITGGSAADIRPLSAWSEASENENRMHTRSF